MSKRTMIVVAIDETAASDAVLPMAVSLGSRMPGAELHLVNVVPHVSIPMGGPVVPSIGEELRTARAYLDGVLRGIAESFTGRIAGHLAVGDPAKHILELASDLQADFIVVGTHGKGRLARMVLGSVSQWVSTKADCPVLLARPKSYEKTPEIAPPCSKCVETQLATRGEALWCEQHRAHHPRALLHYESPPTFAVGSMLLRPQ